MNMRTWVTYSGAAILGMAALGGAGPGRTRRSPADGERPLRTRSV